MMKAVAVIPARYASSRLPAKPLADICGKPMIQWVYEGAQQSKLCSRVVVATDDERVAKVVRAFAGADSVIMTSAEIQSGTDRMAAVAKIYSAQSAAEKAVDIFVNIQGDEPLIRGAVIDQAIQAVIDKKFDLASLRVPLNSVEDLLNPNVVKVIVDDENRALYFSRYPIPYSRVKPEQAQAPFLCSQHVGIYVYRKEALLKISSLPPSDLERAESLEQLRAMKAGIAIGVYEVDFESVGVDTQEDLEKVRRILSHV
jgi:3-deoxy-manno-octulosonate cytidylyltransferase (CMP-KDO synthetase)